MASTTTTTALKGLPPKPRPPTSSSTALTENGSNGGPATPRKKPITRRRSTSSVAHSNNASSSSSTPPLIPKADRDQKRASTLSNYIDELGVRAALQKDVERYSDTLTTSERRFLQELVENGTDQDVEMAHRKLMDENLFDLKDRSETPTFDHLSQTWLTDGSINSHSSNAPTSWAVTGHSASASDLDSSFRSSSSMRDSASAAAAGCEIPLLKSVGSNAGDSVGSERRQELLQQRRQDNKVFDQIWQAHENGLAVTRHRSRRSIRNNTIRFGTSTAAGRSSAIFRRGPEAISTMMNSSSNNSRTRHRAKSPALKNPHQHFMNDNRSDNMRRRPTGPSPIPGGSGTINLPSPLRGVKPSIRRMASDTDNSATPALRRLLSDSSRKSVSFLEIPSPHHGELSERILAEHKGTGPPLSVPRQQRAQRSSSVASVSSIPSIHSAHSVHSTRTAATGSTIPPIPHVNAMLSSSVGSVASIYAEGRDPSNDEASSREEKKVVDLFPRIPTKLEIRQTDNSSKFVKITPSSQHRAPIARYDSCSSEYFQSSSEEFLSSELLSPRDAIAIDPSRPLLDPERAAPVAKVSTPNEEIVVPDSSGSFRRPVLMRDVSIGEGVEVADLAEQVLATPAHMSPAQRSNLGRHGFSEDDGDDLLQMANSFDETMSFRRMNEIFRRPIKRSISDDAAAGLFVGGGLNAMRDSLYANSTQREAEPNETDSWQMDDDEEFDYYDPWLVIEDEYENGYGGGGTLPFQIIGTSANDQSARPHVLSPPLMESLQQFLPFSLTGENFWLKYSLVRDGASMYTFLKHARNAKSSILAVETTDGEVFGAFTSECWRKNWNFYGSDESFLWRMRHSRGEKSRSIIDQAHRESEIDVFPFTGENNNVQYCINGRLAVGGSNVAINDAEDNEEAQQNEHDKMNDAFKDHEWGYGMCLQGDLLEGTSSPCLTFGSPSLSRVHADGSLFEIMNLELWALTPCYSLEEAEKLELGKLFLEKYNRD